MNIIDIIVFLIFTVGTIVFGYLFGRKKQSSDEFTRGNGKVPGWIVGLSIFASFCSSISFLGYCSSAFMGNWNAFVFTLSILPAGLLAMWYFVPFYRSLGSISAYSYFEKRLGVLSFHTDMPVRSNPVSACGANECTYGLEHTYSSHNNRTRYRVI